MGVFSSQAAQRFFVQSNQPLGQQAGALWINEGSTPRPELRIFDGTDWNQEDPVGSIIPFGGAVASIPTGWLLCDNSAVSRTTFSNLFDAIGTFFGTGDGSSTFNLPDMRATFPRGATNAADPGTEGGSDDVTLTTAQMPAHTHRMEQRVGGSDGTGQQVAATGTGGRDSGSTGSGDSHTNLPTFQEFLWIIKT